MLASSRGKADEDIMDFEASKNFCMNDCNSWISWKISRGLEWGAAWRTVSPESVNPSQQILPVQSDN